MNIQLGSYQKRVGRRERGVVLFFTLIALLVMSLAAVALVRSVDTSSLIAGNMAFKQSASVYSDTGVDAALGWLQLQNIANAGIDPNTDPAHPFNLDNAAGGYYSSLDPAVSLTDGTGIQWTDADSVALPPDGSGNEVRYVIQRMCRDANVPIVMAKCLFRENKQTNGSQSTPVINAVCNGGGCPPSISQTPLLRITVRTTGPRFTVSYVQTFVF